MSAIQDYKYNHANPRVNLINKGSDKLPWDLPPLVKALQSFIDDCFYPAWGARCMVVSEDYKPGDWPLTLLDEYSADTTLAYHTLRSGKMPSMFVFTRNCRKFNEPIESAISHEIGESLIDPACNLYAWDPVLKRFHAYEPFDPSEGMHIEMDGFKMQNFVHPGWYEHTALGQHHLRLDEAWSMSAPFKVAPRGYSQIYDAASGQWNYVFGSLEKQKAFAQEDRRGHRTEQRRAVMKSKRSLWSRVFPARPIIQSK